MTLVSLQKLLTPTSPTKNDRLWNFWLCLSLGFAIVCAWLALKEGFSSEWIVQDDARQHVFWMMRYLDPQLFPDDLIANYFQSVAPVGYTSLYKLAAAAGISLLGTVSYSANKSFLFLWVVLLLVCYSIKPYG